MKLNFYSYDFSEQKPYIQYEGCEALQSLISALNDYVRDDFNAFLDEFKKGLDFANSKEYAVFYANEFLGFKPIPEQRDYKYITLNSYDTNLQYDSGTLYDKYADESDFLPYNISTNLYLAVIKAILNYKREIINVEFIDDLLKAWFEASEGFKFDFSQECQIVFKNDKITFTLKNKPVWQSFVILANNFPAHIGLPYSNGFAFELRA